MNKSSLYIARLSTFERRLGRLTEVERVCENSAVWCASHHCLGVAASSAMLGPGRIGTRGILRGINQVRVGCVTEWSIQGKFSISSTLSHTLPKRSEAVMNDCLHSIAQTFNEWEGSTSNWEIFLIKNSRPEMEDTSLCLPPRPHRLVSVCESELGC